MWHAFQWCSHISCISQWKMPTTYSQFCSHLFLKLLTTLHKLVNLVHAPCVSLFLCLEVYLKFFFSFVAIFVSAGRHHVWGTRADGATQSCIWPSLPLTVPGLSNELRDRLTSFTLCEGPCKLWAVAVLTNLCIGAVLGWTSLTYQDILKFFQLTVVSSRRILANLCYHYDL